MESGGAVRRRQTTTEVGRFHAFPDRPIGGRPIRRLSSLLGLETITGLVPRSCLVVEVDDRGRELRTLTDASKTCYWASEAEVIGGWLYIGSWRTPFLARARLPTAN